MEMQSLINIGGTAAILIFGYFYRQNVDKVSVLENKMHDIQISMATDYVRKDELTSHLTRIENMLGKIFDKLDSKVDK